MSDSWLQFFKNNNLNPSLISAPYFPHFLSILSDYKPDGCANEGFTKKYLYSTNKDAAIKDFKA
jgi:hypothetical protein